MKNNRPLILISNDDGFQAKGINCLIDMVRNMGDIVHLIVYLHFLKYKQE